jgi:hypothetical protein
MTARLESTEKGNVLPGMTPVFPNIGRVDLQEYIRYSPEEDMSRNRGGG